MSTTTAFTTKPLYLQTKYPTSNMFSYFVKRSMLLPEQYLLAEEEVPKAT
jgi:hypothetical protein